MWSSQQHLLFSVLLTLFMTISSGSSSGLATENSTVGTKMKILHESDMNREIENDVPDEQKLNSTTTSQMLQQLSLQLQQIQKKISLLQKNLPKQQQEREEPQPPRRVQAVQQQQKISNLKLNKERVMNNFVAEQQKANGSQKAKIKDFRDRFATARDQFRKLTRAKDQPQTQVDASIAKTILKEVPRVQSPQPLPIAKPQINTPAYQTIQSFATPAPEIQPQHLPLVTTTTSQPWPSRPAAAFVNQQQTEANLKVIDKESGDDSFTNSSSTSNTHLPCPKVGWQKIMEKAIKPHDPSTSINQLQAELSRTERGIFVVMCTLSTQQEQFAKNLKLKDDTYCQVIKDDVWCHAGSLSLKNDASFQIGR